MSDKAIFQVREHQAVWNIANFSKLIASKPLIRYETLFEYKFRIAVYVDGNGSKNRGHLGIYVMPFKTLHGRVDFEVYSGDLTVAQPVALAYTEPDVFAAEVEERIDRAVERRALLTTTMDLPDTDCIELRMRFEIRTQMSPVESGLAALFAMRAYCDFKIVCDGGREIEAHRCVLAARSPMFRHMLQSNMSESKTGRFHVSPTTADYRTMLTLIEFLYTGHVRISSVHAVPTTEDAAVAAAISESCGTPTWSRPTFTATGIACCQDAANVFRAADHFGVEDLARVAAEQLSRFITLDTLIHTLEFAQMHSSCPHMETVQAAATSFAEANVAKSVQLCVQALSAARKRKRPAGEELSVKALNPPKRLATKGLEEA